MNTWQAGAASSTFPVPIGTRLGGFADRIGSSTGASDPLEVSALVLRAGDTSLHLLTADLISVDRDLVNEIARAAAISPASLIVAASHTHSGPLGVPLRLHPASEETVDLALRARFVATAADTLAAARSRLLPAMLTHGDTHVSGSWSNRNLPLGITDDRVRMLLVRDVPTQRLISVVLLVPAHPTILGAPNLLVSADLHGGIRRALRRLGNIDIPILTMTGAAGDISTRFIRRSSTLAEVDRIGELVAQQVLDHMPTENPLPAALTGVQREVVLAPRRLDEVETASTLESAEREWESACRDSDASAGDRRVAWTRLQGAEIQARIATLEPMSAELSAWRLGDDLNLATVPGELFTSLGRQIERGASSNDTWVIGYANGYVGYLVDHDAVQTGTYEALASPWSATTSQEVVATAIDIVKSLSESEPTTT